MQIKYQIANNQTGQHINFILIHFILRFRFKEFTQIKYQIANNQTGLHIIFRLTYTLYLKDQIQRIHVISMIHHIHRSNGNINLQW